ncbi:retrotransposon tca3 polyprotein [Moniliophthora roreri MCA 2997]|uniref:Retrotransposon tca3 polyprotein n=1 Tax=Moniliophthora roreri (strain MCA 2997) TaxID=1381753 RepID=V2WNE9_MONRO|nr:retrotransposon tca3 polyprotein [Moniliophthora roreri MCA 2997]
MHSTAKTTILSMEHICTDWKSPETFITDNGMHFKNKEVAEFCKNKGIKHHTTPAYAPWVNGLVKGTNHILLHVLARLCAPELGEDSEELKKIDKFDKLPAKWPDYLEEAIEALNNCILPLFKFTPKELLLGSVVNMPETPLETATAALMP